jgi:multimeric flavodoxin WrbA
MLNQQILLLNGLGTMDQDLAPLLEILIEEIHRTGASLRSYSLQDIKMGTCVGCFGCWLKTPGICLEPDIGLEIAQAVVQSDTTLLLTPVTFGGYSSEIKKIQDRWLPLILPYFGLFHGETHHLPRYSHYPRLVGIGIQRQPNPEEAHLFKTLVGRNAINFHAPTHAAEVVISTNSREQLRQQFQNVLVRNDAVPVGKTITSLMPTSGSNVADISVEDRPSRAILVVGSPKVKSPSTSSVLGGYVLEQLKQRGWEIESLTLRGNLLRGEGQADFLASVERADLLILAFPLYIDALPFLVTKALEVIAAHCSSQPQIRSKRLFAISNNGFPEAHHNAIALAICQRFAVDTGMIWAGGLAMGAGEALSSGLPLTGIQRSGRPPVQHVIQALDLASAALAEGKPISSEANRLMAKTPIPFMPFSMWRWIFMKMARQNWDQQAATNQVSKEDVLAKPYIDIETTSTLVS